MKIVDLTHLIHPQMPVFPGTEKPIFEDGNTLEKDGFLEKKIAMYSHTGTHIDAPAHMLKDGMFLDEYEVEYFSGNGYIIDLTNSKSKYIEIEDLKKYEGKIKYADYLILRTGWSKLWGNDDYFKGFPTLSLDCANWICKFKLKGIGIDAISIDNIESSTFSVHHIFFKEGMIIIENLTNLDHIEKDTFLFMCMPLKTKEADGSPTRAIAIL
ncbi:cyclase family protein [Alkalithermobacter paradoxus]|uniref:Kynurenine formamidase n=1 Tax=Alkalithermobacter paradoxus TaxID=29349 RepID=A0A1V4IB59_9FIRM|nr:kynurenine formamidase [[Clostridium] thermoalcaliphilum]